MSKMIGAAVLSFALLLSACSSDGDTVDDPAVETDAPSETSSEG